MSPAYATPTLTLDPGVDAVNLAVVRAVLDPEGLVTLTVRNASAATADIRVDLVGFYDDGLLGPNLRFRSLPPTRVVTGPRALVAGADTTVTPPSSVAGTNTFALVGTATVVTSTDATDLALWPGSSARPTVGTIPVAASSRESTPVQPELDAAGTLGVGSTAGLADLTLDIVGSFEASPAVTDPTTRGWVDAVPSWQVRALQR